MYPYNQFYTCLNCKKLYEIVLCNKLSNRAKFYNVTLGILNRPATGAIETTIQVLRANAYLHPNFNLNYLTNDIALLKLPRSITLTRKLSMK